jgi:hypothetical protein
VEEEEDYSLHSTLLVVYNPVLVAIVKLLFSDLDL